MYSTTVFIDGREGTTGLQIEERLAKEKKIELITIAPHLRKDAGERKRLINSSDIVFLCLPDMAAVEAVGLAQNAKTIIIDASTAHRTNDSWAYGFPELSISHAERIRKSNRISVPGCHATGFCSIVYPLVSLGLINKSDVLSCFSLTGYSGGGKKMISEYEGENPPRGSRPYALGLKHKHLPEMTKVCGLDAPPIFQPVVAQVRQGMLVSVPLAKDAGEIHHALAAYYGSCADSSVAVMPFSGEGPDGGFLDMEACNDTNRLEIFVFGHERQTLVTARFDNLGKGASGAAVQCMKMRMEGELLK